MANPFSKGWKYMMSSFDQKIDENADPVSYTHLTLPTIYSV